MAKKVENHDHKPSHSEIAARAYALFEQSGRIPGQDMENWLKAEAQLMAVRKEESEKHSRQNERPLQLTPGRNSARPAYRA